MITFYIPYHTIRICYSKWRKYISTLPSISTALLNFHLSRNLYRSMISSILPLRPEICIFINSPLFIRIFTIWQHIVDVILFFIPLILLHEFLLNRFIRWIQTREEEEKNPVIISFTRCARSCITLLLTVLSRKNVLPFFQIHKYINTYSYFKK